MKIIAANKKIRETWGKPEEMTAAQALVLNEKKILLSWYKDIYNFMKENISPLETSVEIGSGSSRLHEYIDGLIKSNIIFIRENDIVFSCYEMPFKDNSVGNIIMISVFHHLQYPELFLKEAERVLKPGGRLLISDPYISLLSFPLWRYLHPEGCDTGRTGFDVEGPPNPLTDANSANATLIFNSGAKKFNRENGRLKLHAVKYHSKLKYWIAGGYNFPQFIPTCLLPLLDFTERVFSVLDRWTASFMYVIVRKE